MGEKSVEDLSKSVLDLQSELSSLRVNKVASGVASKLTKIKVVRKALARTLTIINFKRREELKGMYKNKAALKAFNAEHNTNYRFSDKPLACRSKDTRAIRRKFSKKQLNARTLRAKKLAWNHPQRSFAVRA